MGKKYNIIFLNLKMDVILMNKNIIKDYTNQIIDIWKKESLNSPILNSKMNHSKRVATIYSTINKK